VCVWPAKHHGGSHVEILIPRPLNLLTIPILLHLLLLCRSLSGTQKLSPHAGDYIFEYIYTHTCIYTPKMEGVGGFGVYDGRTVGGQSSCSMARARNSPHAKKSIYSKKSKKF